jgi:hypothetical protein
MQYIRSEHARLSKSHLPFRRVRDLPEWDWIAGSNHVARVALITDYEARPNRTIATHFIVFAFPVTNHVPGNAAGPVTNITSYWKWIGNF